MGSRTYIFILSNCNETAGCSWTYSGSRLCAYKASHLLMSAHSVTYRLHHQTEGSENKLICCLGNRILIHAHSNSSLVVSNQHCYEILSLFIHCCVNKSHCSDRFCYTCTNTVLSHRFHNRQTKIPTP